MPNSSSDPVNAERDITSPRGTLSRVTSNARARCVFASVLAFFVACGRGEPKANAPEPPASPRTERNADVKTAEGTQPRAPEASPASFPHSAIVQRYHEFLATHRNTDHEQYEASLGPRSSDTPLDFDPESLPYYDRIARELSLTAEERAIFRKTGVVSVDHGQRYSMGSSYYAIWARDLPVLITSDSILHALHRSYDALLMELEVAYLGESIDRVLSATHDALASSLSRSTDAVLQESFRDVDLYLTLARNLWAGAGAPAGSNQQRNGAFNDDTWDGTLLIPSQAGNDERALELLTKIEGLQIEVDPKTELYGGRRGVDYSQFRPRGHYTKSTALRRYFRTMMWLGRSDFGFFVAPPDPISRIQGDPLRQTRSAALLTQLIRDAGQLDTLNSASSLIDLLVGHADNLTVAGLDHALHAQQATTAFDLVSDERVLGLLEQLALDASGEQAIRSQVIASPRGTSKQVLPPRTFQVFGQRFVLDSFVLSEVVFDSILFREEKRERMMPSGLDVMAALGNREAAHLLLPEVHQHEYGANLLALENTTKAMQPGEWTSNVYNAWLAGLRALHTLPDSPHVPQVMRNEPWRRKQLQTQLASWAELRHDTILYAKQSYTAVPSCAYPEAFVEPYPEFFRRVRHVAEEAAHRLSRAKVVHPRAYELAKIEHLLIGQARFFDRFASTLQKLEQLAAKELAAQPFPSEEEAFLESTIDIRRGGSGPPRYDGWYPKLIYGQGPASWEPTIADVHTAPETEHGPRTLEVGVGNVQFLVVAIDNEEDRAAYVGPVYSYYEFEVPPSQRLTDEEWQQRIGENRLPPRPPWVYGFTAPRASRHLNQPSTLRQMHENPVHASPKPSNESILRTLRARLASELDPSARARLEREIEHVERLKKPFPSAIARARLEANRHAFDQCHVSEEQANDTYLLVTFEASGAVRGVEVFGMLAQYPALATCVKERYRTVRIPSFLGPHHSVRISR